MKQIILIFASLLLPFTFGSGGYIFTAFDIDGGFHDIQAYLDEGKPVLLMNFVTNNGQTWSIHEDGTHLEIYNTIGQGGTGEVVVLYVAGWGFNNESDIYEVDYSADLGPDYSNIDLTENNPIPIILEADFPSLLMSGKGERLWICPAGNYGWLPSSSIPLNEVMNVLNENCCTTFEDADVGLQWTSSAFAADCDPTQFDFSIENSTANPIQDVLLEVYLNDALIETFVYEELIPPCDDVVVDYSNSLIQQGDEVEIVIGISDANAMNDSISRIMQEVDTVGTTLKIELIDPIETDWVNFIVGSENYSIYPQMNWFNYVFLESGCYSLTLGSWEEASQSQDMVIVGSVDENDTYSDTVFFGPVSDFTPFGLSFTIFAEGEPAVQKTWGYVFEDIDESQEFYPEAPRIEGIEVTHGSQTTFTDANGYYEFELIPGESTSISYDDNIWPVLTTPNAGNVWNDVVRNFGLLSDDPIWSLSTSVSMGIPYLCETGISNSFWIGNSGNQLTNGEFSFVYDLLLTPVTFYPEPTYINGNELVYELSDIAYGSGVNINIDYQEVSSDLLGELLSAQYTLIAFDDQGNVASTETVSLSDTLLCAYDPNDKYGFPLGEGEEGFIPANTPLKYRIRFQNTGNLPATTVVIRDTLPEALNWETFVPAGSTHDNTITMNSDTREVVWTFNDIQLPDSASDPLGSIGTLWFDIEMTELEEGDLIENTAYIFFDQNEAIITNTSLHTIAGVLSAFESEADNLKVYPNPANDILILAEVLPPGSVLELYDINGRLILQNPNSTGMIDLSQVEEGMYFLRLLGDSQRSVKVVVSR